MLLHQSQNYKAYTDIRRSGDSRRKLLFMLKHKQQVNLHLIIIISIYGIERTQYDQILWV